jgi:hypothetical protein
MPTETETTQPTVNQPEPMAFTLRQTASLLNISYMSAFRLVQRGKLRSCGAMRTKLISREELQRFLRDTTQAA